jgi:hypothetical protein
MLEVVARERAQSVEAQELALVENPRKDAAQPFLVDQRENAPPA